MKQGILLNLQQRYQDGGYVLVAPDSGRVYAFGKDIKKLHEKIISDEIPSTNKLIMYVPSPKHFHLY